MKLAPAAVLLLSLLAATTAPLASATANCLYCRRSDLTATLLVSFSYCQASDTCLQDRWNYIDRPCSTKWVRGVNTALDDCTPKLVTCHPFVSTPAADQNWFNFTETLGANEYCTIEIDASQYLARVVLDDAITVGAQYTANAGDTYKTQLAIGQQLTVEAGNKIVIEAYNGDTAGSITFTLAFRNALNLRALTSALAFAAVTLLTAMI